MVPEWSPSAQLEVMAANNITKAILSISTPGTNLVYSNPSLAISLTRQCNTYAADLKRQNPAKFGYWASLPLPHIDASLAEIAQASANGADGFALLTNYHGHYLGEDIFGPIFAELNRRKAVVFIHPTTPCTLCADNNGTPTPAAPLAHKFPRPMMEFLFDTARVVANLLLSGTVARCPNITFIIPHAGGALPAIFSRFTGFTSMLPGPWTSMSEDEARAVLARQFYFDLAGFAFPGQIVGLVQGVGVGLDRLLYGSDFPFTKPAGVQMLREKMDECVEGMWSKQEREMVYEGNARRLLAMAEENHVIANL